MKNIPLKKGGEKEKKERRYIICGGSTEGKRIRRRWCSVFMATLTAGEARHTEAFIWLSAHMTPLTMKTTRRDEGETRSLKKGGEKEERREGILNGETLFVFVAMLAAGEAIHTEAFVRLSAHEPINQEN